MLGDQVLGAAFDGQHYGTGIDDIFKNRVRPRIRKPQEALEWGVSIEQVRMSPAES